MSSPVNVMSCHIISQYNNIFKRFLIPFISASVLVGNVCKITKEITIIHDNYIHNNYTRGVITHRNSKIMHRLVTSYNIKADQTINVLAYCYM